VERGKVELLTTLDSERDFVHVDDLARILPEIALRGRSRVYNVASGHNTRNADIADALQQETGCAITVAEGAERSFYPTVDVSLLREELGFVPSGDVLSRVPGIVHAYRQNRAGGSR
jgi:nucleoside-diphosphate-sugar epimerase